MGKDITSYIDGLSNDEYKSIITVEHRSSNAKRDFLFVNKLQGKHIPTRTCEAFDLFDELAYKVETNLKGKVVLVVGFAETATAIGGYIADTLERCLYSIQTTRENCAPAKKLIEFREEHSHATEQYLYGDLEAMPPFDYVLFVEDEISTGKTILNFITEFKKLKPGLKFGVASICNWQNEENKAVYRANNIDTFALIQGELKDANAKMEVEVKESDVDYSGHQSHPDRCKYSTLHMGKNPFLVERTGRISAIDEYEEVLDKAFDEADKFIGKSKDILVLGTEEFMYFPMLLGEVLENFGRRVHTHATTRSSIDILEGSSDIHEEIVNKSKLHSAYDESRDTYIYNLRKYDKVIIVTDAAITDEFKYDIVSALTHHGNIESNILFIKVEE